MRAVLLLLLLTGVASADSFGGWTFTAPSGYTRSESGDHVTFQQVKGALFCQLALYTPRALADTHANEAAADWKVLVESAFGATNVKKHPVKKARSGAEYLTTTATGKNTADGGKFAIALYAVVANKQVAPVLLAAPTDPALAKCASAVTAMLDSLATETAAPAAVHVGRWANSAAAPQGYGAQPGSVKREYTFAADGTYRFHAERHTGRDWHIIDESGAWTLAGDKLTVAPKTAKLVIRDDKTQKTQAVKLEKVTYTVKRHFFEGIGETNLVLTPPAKTARDGEYASNEQFKASYLYSDQYKPEWRY